jgi:hypothetical protein
VYGSQEELQLLGSVVESNSFGMDMVSSDRDPERDLESKFFCAAAMGRLLKIMIGEFFGYSVKVQCVDFDSFILIPYYLLYIMINFEFSI